MANYCENCGKKNGFWGEEPVYLNSEKILCCKCAKPIREKISMIYNAKTHPEIEQYRNEIMSVAKEIFNESIIFELNSLIDRIKSRIQNEDVKTVEEIVLPEGVIYSVEGVRGRHLFVYEDKIVINTEVTLGSLFTGNVTDGEKTIYYVDCVGIQFKQSGALIGYLQLETSAGQMNNKHSNFFAENSFTYDTTKISNDEMAKIVDYIKERIDTYKNKGVNVTNVSAADEIKKFKELLDADIITKDEFEAKKKQLLGL